MITYTYFVLHTFYGMPLCNDFLLGTIKLSKYFSFRCYVTDLLRIEIYYHCLDRVRLIVTILFQRVNEHTKIINFKVKLRYNDRYIEIKKLSCQNLYRYLYVVIFSHIVENRNIKYTEKLSTTPKISNYKPSASLWLFYCFNFHAE